MSTPKGLNYFPKFVSDDLTVRVLDFLNTCNLFPVTSHPNSRKVAQYGYAYNYKSGNTNQKVDPFPSIIEELMKTTEGTFDQCIINRYLPGQGIGKHIDALSYGNTVCCFTFGSGAEIEFTRGTEVYKLYTEPQSLYVMSDEARYEWAHQMKPRSNDLGHGPRGVRWSITFRTV